MFIAAMLRWLLVVEFRLKFLRKDAILANVVVDDLGVVNSSGAG